MESWINGSWILILLPGASFCSRNIDASESINAFFNASGFAQSNAESMYSLST